MILNSLFPVFALIILGTLLKHNHLTGDVFFKTSDRLVYYVFFPAMLFWKIGGASMVGAGIDLKYCLAAICSVLSVYILSSTYIKVCDVEDFKAGSFSQSCYHLSLSLAASAFKLLLFPAIGYFFLKIFSVTGIAFQVGMIFFALPTSTAIYVLSSQLNSDTKYASSAIVLSTCLSFLALFAVLALFG